MKRLLACAVMGLVTLGALGCAEEAEVKKQTKVSTPGGTTTVTTEKEVKQTGDNPPPAP